MKNRINILFATSAAAEWNAMEHLGISVFGNMIHTGDALFGLGLAITD